MNDTTGCWIMVIGAIVNMLIVIPLAVGMAALVGGNPWAWGIGLAIWQTFTLTVKAADALQ